VPAGRDSPAPLIETAYTTRIIRLLTAMQTKFGSYATALQHLRPLADQGDARAQFILGAMYAEGQGVPQNFADPVKWYRLAADRTAARQRDRGQSLRRK
jgi:TPR repeat protein